MELTSFKDVNWLKYNILNRDNALEYFSLSPFYDRTCNNELLKMQSIETTLNTGIEYRVMKECETLVIEKFERPKENTVSLYYIVEGSIYMSPNLHALISSRLTAAAFYLKETPYEDFPTENTGVEGQRDKKILSKVFFEN